MPIPKPSGETQDDFIERCMGDDAMQEYPQKQRYAICLKAWNDRSRPMTIERRYFPATEVRVDKKEKGNKLTGYAAVFNSLSEDLGGFREKIDKGAFSKSIKGDVRALWNHNPDYVLGRTRSGTLALGEDDNGLKIEVDPPDTQWARDLMTSISRGDVTQMSFGFRTVTDAWEEKEGANIRTLKDLELIDISPVTFPAYTDTTVALRSMQEWHIETHPEPPDSESAITEEEEQTYGHRARARARSIELTKRHMEE